MELYILSNTDLSTLAILECSDYEINLDNQFTDKSTFRVNKTDGQIKDNFLVVNGLYQQFLFIIDEVEATDKEEKFVNLICSDISNVFNRKIIQKDTNLMTSRSIEYFLAHMIDENFINSDDSFLNKSYVEVTYYESTQAKEATNAENGIYNFHTFMENCREHHNVFTDFKFEDNKLKVTIKHKEDTPVIIDTTLPEITNYNKVYEQNITAKVQVYIRENDTTQNYYLKTDRTITTNKNDPNRASGAIEVISVETEDDALQEATNVFKGNTYKHLVEFSMSKNSKLVDTTQLYICRAITIKTPDGIYDSIISGISLDDDNFINFKSGNIRINFIDKLKQEQENYGNKLDVTGGTIKGNLTTQGNQTISGNETINGTMIGKVNIRPQASLGNNEPNGAGWYKVCQSTMSAYGNTNIIWIVANNYAGGYKGLLNLEMRSNNGSIECWNLSWIARSGFPANSARLVINGNTWTLYFYRHTTQYGKITFHELIENGIGAEVNQYPITYYNSTTKESTEPTATNTSVDGFTTNYSNSSNTAKTLVNNLGSGVIANTNIIDIAGSTDGLKLDFEATTSDVGVAKLYTTDDGNARLELGNNVSGTYKRACYIENGKVLGNKSGNWNVDRDNALIRQSYANGYSPVICQGTPNGTWTIGNLQGNESLYFNYVTDSDYNNNVNNSKRWTINNGGAFSGQSYKLECPWDRGSLTNANISHTYENARSHLTLITATSNMTSNKPTGDGIILHTSWDNSGQYCGQMYFSHTQGNPVQYRLCNNGTWTGWENIYKAKFLYSNASGTTGSITLSESAANFTFIEILYGDTKASAERQYCKAWQPNGKWQSLQIVSSTSTTEVQDTRLNTRTVGISGTSFWTGAQEVNYVPGGGRWNVNEITVYAVIGYR